MADLDLRPAIHVHDKLTGRAPAFPAGPVAEAMSAVSPLPAGGRGGGCGIRTHGDPEATTAFEAAPFVRSGNPPPDKLAAPGGEELL